ncbi:MAG: Transcription-repair-coupling factor [Deltaproteobacteria bacterium ADurb.Bin510]|nr:MAG: Transcription-repair-coupling factor [Deltaproteobacteria bacterium ADurb.Bin510]
MLEQLASSYQNAPRLSGLPSSLQALLLAAANLRSNQPVLWLVEDQAAVEKALNDLACYVSPERFVAFPAPDVRPYQDDSCSREVAAQRLSVLSRLVKRENLIVVTTPAAVMPVTLPRAELRDACLTLTVGQEAPRERLLSELVRLGYESAPLIDDVGQFSVRGFVLDLFSPGMASPVRLDFFGDAIEDMKTFDLETQRSRKPVRQIEILPVSEIILSPARVKQARPILRRLGGETAALVVSDIEQGVLSPGIENFLPCFYETTETLIDYLPDSTIWAVACGTEAAAQVCETFETAWRKAHEAGRCMPEPNELLRALPARIMPPAAAERVAFHEASLSPELMRISGSATLDYLAELKASGLTIFVYAATSMLLERLEYALGSHGLEPRRRGFETLLSYRGLKPEIFLIEGELSSGFILNELNLALISAEELLGTRKQRRRRRAGGQSLLNSFTELNVGDAVVHRDNGIAQFKGVERLELGEVKADFVVLEYLGGDKLYVPVDKLGLLQRYVGDTDALLLDKLGGPRWAKAKAKAQESVMKLAGELLEIYAQRAGAPGLSYDTACAGDFEASFAFEETDDQLKAIEEVYADLAAGRPMDRLICGDVGFGKTDCFVTAMAGRQVAVLVPTTLLARQHLRNFRERFEGWPFKIEGLTSFASSAENQRVAAELKAGKVDIVIGTQALLSNKIGFSDLGLLVVDEEHKFGVAHKEKIKALRATVDVLTLTATPIPRTLNMAISGIRDISVIETPPTDRKAIATEVARYDEQLICETIERELKRGGQAFFVHNQVRTIEAMAEKLGRLLPHARIGVAHGQQARGELEQVMEAFVERKVNLLVCSAIISSGIDISNANTIIINRADKFGLADLYQLRGRVGRSKTKGYALLLTPAAGPITKDAHKRLSAIKEYEALGSGFRMALRDMEIRGVGDILGQAQWGQVTAIGFELYQQMLDEAVKRLQGQDVRAPFEPEINLGLDAYVPEDYCPDQHLRLGFYKRLAGAATEELYELADELKDLYGPLPEPVKALLAIAEIRNQLKSLRIAKLERANNRLRLVLPDDNLISLDKLIASVTRSRGKLYPDGKADILIDETDVLGATRAVLDALVPDGLRP